MKGFVLHSTKIDSLPSLLRKSIPTSGTEFLTRSEQTFFYGPFSTKNEFGNSYHAVLPLLCR